MRLPLHAFTVLAAAGLIAGCDSPSTSSGSSTGQGTTRAPANDPPRNAPAPAPDNTAKNERDAEGRTKTPMDQSNAATDIDITAAIRKAVVADESLSVDAHNCKIITEKGMVTLRGPVSSQAEKDAIERIAATTAGVKAVVNELEVKAKP